MGLFKEVELILPPEKQNNTVNVNSLNGYAAIRGVQEPTKPKESTKPKTKVSIGLQFN